MSGELDALERFGAELWEVALQELRGEAALWWRAHRDTLEHLSRAEMQDIAASLRQGDAMEAKLAVVARMSREEFVAYRDGTTSALRGIAARRANMLAALNQLGKAVARALGIAILGALGA